MTTVAAIDCGTNTIKLLIADVTADAGAEFIREMRVVRLGQDVDRTGVLASEALARTFAAVEEYQDLIEKFDVPPQRVRFVATSATRDAANSEVFMAGIRERLGVDPEVVRGTAEAALAFGGALGNLRETPTSPVMVIDIGGGSTELTLGYSAEAGPDQSYSMDIGCVRLTERHLRSDPPTASEIDECVQAIDQQLDGCLVDPADAATAVGVAGTITQLTVGVLGLDAYDRSAVDQAVIASRDVAELTFRLAAMTVEQRRALSWMHPGRADVIVAGALILVRILERGDVDRLVVSESDILDGIANSIA